MDARIRSRLRSEPLVGFIVMIFASGVLVGVFAGRLSDTRSDALVSAGPTGAPSGSTDGATALGEGAEVATGGGAPGGVAGTSGATGAASAPGDASGGGSPGAETGGATGGGGAVRGVTDNSIKLGIACLDLGAFKAVPQYDIGDNQAHFASVLDGWKRAGMVPVHGRNIELAQRCFSPLSAEDQRSTAVELVRDKKVFAVGAMTTFRDGAEIVSQEFKTPILSVSPLLSSSYQRGWPYLFTVEQELTLAARNFAHWIKDRNLVNKKIGIYYLNDPYQPASVRAMQAELAKLGNRNSVAVGTDNLLGGPTDAVAVQRFRAEGVEVVALLTSPAGFVQAAAAQRYKPHYVQTDFSGPYVNDTATATYDADNFDGALAMTPTRIAEVRMGVVARQTKECEDNYFKFTGRRIDASDSAKWGALTRSCEVMNLLYAAISKAGRNLTQESFIQAMATVNLEGAHYGHVAFAPTKHDGGSTFRTVVWKKACACWSVLPPPAFRPFFVQ